jgi:hypothetical protein
MYLDLPVCAPICVAAPCVARPIEQDAHHAHEHSRKRVTERHDGLARTIGAFFRHLHRADQCDLSCHYEVPVDTLPGYPRKEGKDARLICDFALTNVVTQEVTITDVRVTHPDRNDPRNSASPLAAAERNWREKQLKYVNNYDISTTAIQPLVFEVYGGWAQGTFEYLRTLIRSIAGGDDKLFAVLWQDLRDRVAVSLATGQAAVIDFFNFKNSLAPWTAQTSPPVGRRADSNDGTTSPTNAPDVTGLAPGPSMPS